MIAARAHVVRTVLAASVIAAASAAQPRPQPASPDDWCVGTIERGSLERRDDGYRMRLQVEMCHRDLDAHRPQPRELVVTYPHELPYDVCEGSYVYVPGEQHGMWFAASGLYITQSKYDGCLHERCLPDAQRSPRCRHDTYFK